MKRENSETTLQNLIINLSCYQFVRLNDLPALRERLRHLCDALALKGTILLAPEGINFFVAGTRKAIDQFMAELRTLLQLPSLTAKESESAKQPFRRMLVKIKKEIIAFGIEGLDPAAHPAPYLKPQTLKTWLDEGKPLILFDTRNDYEIRMGTFKKAVPANIQHFRKFPEAVKKLSHEWKEQTIVTFCTGGIRCEKAAPFMEREGFQNVFQLEGGILNYFKECGGAHYQGECFVFDQRVGVNPALEETASVMCFACQMPLTLEEQQHPHFQVEKSCPHCFGREKLVKPPKTRRSRRTKKNDLQG